MKSRFSRHQRFLSPAANSLSQGEVTSTHSKQLAISTYLGRLLSRIWASPRGLGAFVIIALAGVILGLYVNSLDNRFVQWDDPGLILTNRQIRSLEWPNIKEIFSVRKASTYQPIRVLSYALDYHFWKLNPLGYHITNMVFYFLTCVLTYFATHELLKLLRGGANLLSNQRVAFFTALIFAVHPVHVEAVTWLSARKEVLLGAFLFGSFFFYLRATAASSRSAKIALYGVAFLCFLLAALSKPVAVVLPAVILVFELSRARLNWELLKKRVLWFVPVLLVSMIVIYILLRVMVEADGIYPYRGGGLLGNSLTAFYVFLLNIKLLAFTINFSPVYMFPLSDSVLRFRGLISLPVNIALLSFAVMMFKRNRLLCFVIIWFYATLLPFSNIIPISTLVADRYLFIPSFAFCLVLALGFEKLWSVRLKDRSKDFFPFLAATVLIFLLMGYSYMTICQNRVWKDSFSLWSDALAKDAQNTVAMNSLGVIYLENEMNQEALEILKRAIDLDPQNPQIHSNLGIVQARMRRPAQSEYHYLMALSLQPDHYEASVNLSNLYAENGEFEAAIRVLSTLASERPHDAMVYFRLGVVYEDTDELSRAIENYEKSMELRPDIMNPYESLGRLYLDKLNDRERALYFFRKGVEMAPRSKRVGALQAEIKRLSASHTSLRHNPARADEARGKSDWTVQ
jgi:tetratricopeptide (TPR) repeat protein